MPAVAPGASPPCSPMMIQKSLLSFVSAFLTHFSILVPYPHPALGSTPEVKTTFDFPVSLEYCVTLSERELGADLCVINHSNKDALEFQALFHNYLRAPANDVKISPLAGKNFFDKTEATAEAKATSKLELRKEVDVKEFTDSVYVDGGQAYHVSWSRGGIQIETEGLKDVVIWNPQETVGKAIGDMEDGGWYVRPSGFQEPLLTPLPPGRNMSASNPVTFRATLHFPPAGLGLADKF
jgi:hypothetical protein